MDEGKMDRRKFLKTAVALGATVFSKNIEAATGAERTALEFHYSPDFHGLGTPETANAIAAWIDSFLFKDKTFIDIARERSKAPRGEFGKPVKYIEYDGDELRGLDTIKWPSKSLQKIDSVTVKIEPQETSLVLVHITLRDKERKWLAIVSFQKRLDTR